MKKAFFTLTFLIFIAFSTNIVKSNEPCYPDCENSQWSTQQSITFFLQECNAEVTVYYRYRIACGIWYDYYIDYVLLGDASDCLDDHYGGDLNMMMRDICEALIVQNPANFPPYEEGQCELNWRVLKGSCWRPDIIPHVPKIQANADNKSDKEINKALGIDYDILIPCSSNDCCLEYFRVCINNGIREITQTGYLPPEDPDCINNPGCFPVCGSVYNR